MNSSHTLLPISPNFTSGGKVIWGLNVGGVITVGFFRSPCWVWTGFLGTGGTVDRQTVGWEVINQGGDGRFVVLVVDAGKRQKMCKTNTCTKLLGNYCMRTRDVVNSDLPEYRIFGHALGQEVCISRLIDYGLSLCCVQTWRCGRFCFICEKVVSRYALFV